MKDNKKLFVFILLITLFSVILNLPKNFKIGNVNLGRPDFDISLGPLRFSRDLEIKKGLDLAGGTHLVLSADMSKINKEDRTNALNSLREIIERRVNLYGLSEPVVQTAKVGEDYRVIVEIPGVTDLSQAVDLVGKTAQLTFRESANGTPSAKISTLSAMIYGPYQIETELSGKDLKKAEAGFNQQNGEPIVNLTFNSEGAKKFEAITKRNLNKQLAIFLDDQMLMAPTVQSVISGGQAYISGQFTAAQTKTFALLLNSGALPAPVKIAEQRSIGATLGDESVKKSLIAGAIGLGVVALFMLVNYGRLGILADLALITYALLTLTIFKLVPVTLTLAGIGGFILSIGMAVDANILIFERIKEEIRWGKDKLVAIELGFSRAFPSIRDSNASSLITCAILYWFGSGPVRGFAVTLAIGIAISLFTAITVTRTYLRIITKK